MRQRPRPAPAQTAAPELSEISDDLSIPELNLPDDEALTVASARAARAAEKHRPVAIAPIIFVSDPVLDPVVPASDLTATTVERHPVGKPRVSGGLEAKLNHLLTPTTAADLARAHSSRPLKTMKESDLRELIQTAVGTVMIQQGGTDDATIDRIQAELQRSMVERSRADAASRALTDRLARAEAACAAAQAETAAAQADSDAARAELAAVRSGTATITASLSGAAVSPLDSHTAEAMAHLRTQLDVAHEALRAAALNTQQADDDFLMAQSDLAARDRELAEARDRLAQTQQALAEANGRLELATTTNFRLESNRAHSALG